MRSVMRIFPSIVVLGLVGGCVGTEAPSSTSPPRTASSTSGAPGLAGTQFDGTYSGILGAPTASGSGTGSQCYQSGSQQTLRIVNGQLRGGILFRQFDGPVGADGSLNVTGPDTRNNGNPGTIEGRVTPTSLDGSFTYRAGSRTTCTYSLIGLTRS